MFLFEEAGFTNALRMGHVIVGIMWMGLLWFFNFVQVPAAAEMDPAARSNMFDKLSWRALWWFRWAAAATVLFGLLIIGIGLDTDAEFYTGKYFFQSSQGVTLLIGIIMGIVMFLNVWLIIWPKQQIVIGNARNVAGGGEANPGAPAAARRGLMASRQNTIFSLPLLVFMVGASHFYNLGDFQWLPGSLSSGKAWTFIVIGLVIVAVLQLNAMGKISGTGSGGLNVIYETHKNAMITGFALIVVFYVLAEILLTT